MWYQGGATRSLWHASILVMLMMGSRSRCTSLPSRSCAQANTEMHKQCQVLIFNRQGLMMGSASRCTSVPSRSCAQTNTEMPKLC